MNPYFGTFCCTFIAAVLVVLLVRAGFEDGDRFGDARVRLTLRRGDDTDATGETSVFAVVTVDNPNDSPVMVSGRARRASVPVALLRRATGLAGERRTQRVRRRRASALELLGAVDGRGENSWLLPVESTGRGEPGAVRVRVVVDQVAGRSRVFAGTLLAPRGRRVNGAQGARSGVNSGVKSDAPRTPAPARGIALQVSGPPGSAEPESARHSGNRSAPSRRRRHETTTPTPLLGRLAAAAQGAVRQIRPRS